MTEDLIRVPNGLTTDGLIGRRYFARFIDSTLIGLIAIAVLRSHLGRGEAADRDESVKHPD